MSVLETPRIYFRGQMTWDPITTNNYPRLYDETDAEPVFPGMTNKVAAYRTEATAAVAKGNWNPQGTHRSVFYESAISGADLGARTVLDDPFVSAPALFRGMLVDLEPYGAYSSQLFFDAMSFGIAGGYRIEAPRSTRFTDRYINFNRNAVGVIAGVASVVWQTCFPKDDGLRVDAFDSPALQALQKALEHDDVLGITVQFNSYRTIYYNTPDLATDPSKMGQVSAQLISKIKGGGFQPNPARSMMVGVIGLWRRGEPVNEPCDRTLVTGPAANPNAPTIASAHLRVGDESLTLDLSNSVSETGLDLVKADFGELSVVAVDASGNATTLASFGYSQYDKTAYERSSGIVTLPVTADQAKLASSSTLQLRNAGQQVLLAEDELRALPLVPNLYMNQGGGKQTATFQVYQRGVPAGAGIPVTICVMANDGGSVASTFALTTNADGTVSFELDDATAGITAYVALPGPNPVEPTQGIDPQVNTYLYVRVLPADEATAQLPPTWENVYSRVLANWHALAPCMDNWLQLGNEAQVRAYGSLLKMLTAESAFEHFRYMPVTRDMTPGERTLLYNFLDSAPPAHVAVEKAEAVAADAPERQPVNFAELSRKMRS